MPNKDKRTIPGKIYYGTDGLIKGKDGIWREDPKTFRPIRKAKKKKETNSVNA